MKTRKYSLGNIRETILAAILQFQFTVLQKPKKPTRLNEVFW